jgi:very-short-patch-repair endonuclease
LSATVLPAINVALWANHVPVLSELSLGNDTADRLDDVEIEVESIPPAVRSRSWRLAQVSSGQMCVLKDLDIKLDGPWLASLTESVRGTVIFRAKCGERLLVEVEREVRFLAHNEWGGSAAIPDVLAAFVEPNDPAVPVVLRKASDLLRAQSKPDSLEGYQATSKQRLWEQAAAIWSAVCSLDIRYVNPPPSFEREGQRIRPPSQVLHERLATCLDLAVLFGACLEHVGLRPLIVLTKGHAFAGVWLSRHDFGASVASDAPSLRTRLALHDLLVFETTLCCQSPAPGFKRACAAGTERVAAEFDGEFEGIVDVMRARQRRILPMGSASGTYARISIPGVAGDLPEAGPPQIEEAPPLRDDEDEPDAEAAPASAADRLARWQKRLLDLSGRNRLLNLRVGGKQALAIDCHDPAKLEDALAGMRGVPKAAPFRFQPWPDLMSGADPRSAVLHRDRMNEAADRAFARDAQEKRELLVALDEEKLQGALTELYRTARAAAQEGGANTLFLTIGALLWKAKGKDKPYRAPLVLVPAILERPSVRSGFRLRAHDDETRVNSTLLEMLKEEYGIRLPDMEAALPEDGSGLDVNAILDAFRRQVREIPGWEVTEDIAITNLSFTKYLMWKDLTDRADELRANEVARRLMDGAQETDAVEPSSSHGGAHEDYVGATLDEDPMLATLACPMEADSSQLRAVAAAAHGESYVLIGPPGTGKSQTIANIISNTLAQGRSVLFVAEKRAALEVVQRRLRMAGLGDFCLDLFSVKASKMAVLEQLNHAQEARETIDPGEWATAHQEGADLRAELNGYVRELHRRGRNGWTAYRAIGCILRAETGGVPDVSLSWPDADTHDAAAYQKLVEAVEDAAAVFSRLSDIAACTALVGIDRPEWSPSWQAAIVEAARASAMALGHLQKAAAPAVRALSLPAELPLTLQAFRAIDALAGMLLDPASQEAAWALASGSQDTLDALRSAAEVARAHADLASRLSTQWTPDVKGLPLTSLLADWREAATRWWPARRSRQKAILERLRAAAADVPEDPVPDLQKLIAMAAKEAELGALAEHLAPTLGRRWRGLQTDFSRLDEAGQKATGIRAAAAACAPDPTTLLALRGHIQRLLGDGADLLANAGAVGAPLQHFRAAYAEAMASLAALAPLCCGEPQSAVEESREDWATALAEHLGGWVRNARLLRDWCGWRGVTQRAESIGLAPLLRAMESGSVAVADTPRVFEANYARWWISVAVDDLPRLRAFVAAAHEQRIERFRALDKKLLDLSARFARAGVIAGVPGAAERSASSEFAVLTHELAKRQRHLPVRQLLNRMPHALRRLTPCLMMSPLSVAQYLPANAAPFDLVIFDEASQIPTWDAIGAIGRGRQVIVAGDPKQLPPTRFFERVIPESGENSEGETVEVDTEDLESILDECRGAGIRNIELTWHYRSRYEALIAFSNYQYYGGRLVTFPSPVVKDTAVSYRHVADGVYARAGARTNQAEAQAVVAEVVGHLRAIADGGPEKSIGIVSFNAEQQALIENLLDQARRDDPSIERFFSEDLAEPVLVKNLEGVQGEERDVIIFSLTYGPDVTGRVSMNFGPMNQSGGERRLNVAVTRAREAMIVFGSLRADHIDLNRTSTSAVGVAHLKQFLAYAEHGARAFATAATGPLGDFESPFEAAVAERLRNLGWVVHPQIGVSGFRVDLGVVNVDAPGAYLAGVECDGATYHRAASARDRDRLRQAVLENLGWRILRVWSTDWWTNARREADRLHAVLNEMLHAAREARSAVQEASTAAAGHEVAPQNAAVAESAEEFAASGDTAPASAAPPDLTAGLDPERFYDIDYVPRLTTLVEVILRAEAPMRDEQLAQRVARAHGFQRTGRRIRDAVFALVPRGCAITKESEAAFIWPPSIAPSSWSVFRDPGRGEQRDPADVPIEELAALARRVLHGAADEEAALILMRDACGLAKLRDATRERCEAAIRKVSGTLI